MEPYKKPNHNEVQCLKCNDRIRSYHCHDFKTCKCGHVSVDGGLDYHRRLWSDGKPMFVEIDAEGNQQFPAFRG